MSPRSLILQGHCLEQMATLPAGSVHCCVTSPPYWGLRDYNIPPVHWPEVTFSPMAGLPPITIPAQEAVHGLEPDMWAYIGHEVSVFREVRRVLREDGVLFLNLGDAYCSTAPGTMGDALRQSGIFSGVLDATAEARRKYRQGNPLGLKPKDLIGIPWRVAFALQADGWWLRSEITWCKKSAMPESCTDRPSNATEKIFLFSKSASCFYDNMAVRTPLSEATLPQIKQGYEGNGQKDYLAAGVQNPSDTKRRIIASLERNGGANLRNYWLLGPEPFQAAHFATFPTEIPRRAILLGTSAKGCCAECGAPWERELQASEPRQKLDYNGKHLQSDKSAAGRNILASIRAARKSGGDHDSPFPNRKTLGWQPTCECHGHFEMVEVTIPPSDKASWNGGKFDDGKNAATKPNQGEHSEEPKVKLVRVYRSDLPLDQHPIQPCTVLDPFLGSATTAQVALELGRNAIGCELNPDYITLGNNRTNVTPGLNLA